MNELYREIEEDIRRERFDKLWHSFGKVMVYASIAIILATIVVVVFQNHTQSQAMDTTSQFMKGIDRLNIEDYKGAIPIFESVAKNGPSNYYAIAMLRKAQAEIALGNADDAKKTYSQLAERDAVFGRLALMLSGNEEDKKLTEGQSPSTTEPFYYTRTEWQAWQMLKKGKKDEAVKQFLAIYNDTTAPASMHNRIAETLRHIAPDTLGGKMPDFIPMGAKTDTKDLPHE